jgi:subfamily B ATP-binding cassette protein MsbA
MMPEFFMTKGIKEKGLNLYFRTLSYLRPYIRQVVYIVVFNLLFVIFNTLSIWMIAPLINSLFESTKVQSEQQLAVDQNTEDEISIIHLNDWLKQKIYSLFQDNDPSVSLKILCILIFLTFLLKNLFAFLEMWYVSFIEQKVIKDLRDEVYGHVVWQPLSFFQKYQTGNLISRITNDISSLNVAVNNSFTRVIRDPAVIIVFMIILINISWQLTLISAVIFPISGIFIQKVGQSLKRKSKRVQEKIADLTIILQETISGIKIVKAFTMEKFENDKFKNKTNEHFRNILRQARLNRLSSPLSETLGIGIVVCVLWFGGQYVLSGQSLSSEDFIRFIAVLYSIMQPIKSLGGLNNNIQIALASATRVFKIIDTPNTITDREGAIEKKTIERDISYVHVDFRYGEANRWVLQDVNLKIDKNQKVAFVGRSGAGKTTLVNLLPRFYDLEKGSIKIDNMDIRELKLKSLRNLIGIVTQEVILFNDTVANNIAYGMSDYPLKKIEEAAKMANAHDFIINLPEGYQTIIGERGLRLSGGQRQRISIARAILKNPPILIFDEATSSLDSESESQIQEAIENLMKDRTVFIIAHRLSSVIKADKIILLENGILEAQGSHKNLISSCSRYRELYNLQFAI